MNLKINIIICFLLSTSFAYSQMEAYNYKRELQGVTDQWHKVVLSNDVFGKVSNRLSDIRIFGIKADNDTIETPYVLKWASEKILSNPVSFKLINQSRNEKGYYFTFEVPDDSPINEIDLDFSQQNFDWRLKLEGSQNQQEWFSIVENYRVLSIKNESTDYQFSKIVFPDAKYRFFRLLIESKKRPNLVKTKTTLHDRVEGNYRNYTIEALETKAEKQKKQTVIDLDLGLSVPVSYLKIDVKQDLDYYRRITIKYLSDSIKTPEGWQYNYSTLTTETLNSIEENEFKLPSTVLRKLKIIIHNQDNTPLRIDGFIVKGYVYELLARFTDPAKYFLVYGNKNISKPHYDITRFIDKIPDALTTLNLGLEEEIEKEAIIKMSPLFENKTWLWLIMGVIIVLLGWFSMKMIKNNN